MQLNEELAPVLQGEDYVQLTLCKSGNQHDIYRTIHKNYPMNTTTSPLRRVFDKAGFFKYDLLCWTLSNRCT